MKMADNPQAVRYFVPDNPQLVRVLRLKLQELVHKEIAALASNYAQDWPDYKFRTGKIQGLNDAIQVCEEAEKELE